MGIFSSKFEGECLLKGFDPGHYKSGAKLGEGAYGQVTQLDSLKKSPQKDLPSTVALKVVTVRNLTEEDRREYQILHDCDHKNILKLFYWKIVKVPNQNDQLYMYTELCNSNLGTFWKDKQLSINSIKYICFQMIQGCEYLHSKQVVHRDIKPANILVIQREGNVDNAIIKLADFGLSRFMPANVSSDFQHTACGTWAYASPELIKAFSEKEMVISKHPFATDIFSLGVVIFETIAKKCPFSLAELVQANHDPTQVVESNVSDPKMVECLINMLQWDPKMRIEAKMLLKCFPCWIEMSQHFQSTITTTHYVEEVDVLIVGCEDGPIFTCNSQGEKKELENGHNNSISCIRHHQRDVVICDNDGIVSLWKFKNDQLEFLKILQEDDCVWANVDISANYVASNTVDKGPINFPKWLSTLTVWKRGEDGSVEESTARNITFESEIFSLLIYDNFVLCGALWKVFIVDAQMMTVTRVVETGYLGRIESMTRFKDQVYAGTNYGAVFCLESNTEFQSKKVISGDEEWILQVLIQGDSLYCLTEYGQLKCFSMENILKVGETPLDWEKDGKEVREEQNEYHYGIEYFQLSEHQLFYVSPANIKVIKVIPNYVFL